MSTYGLPGNWHHDPIPWAHRMLPLWRCKMQCACPCQARYPHLREEHCDDHPKECPGCDPCGYRVVER